MANVEAARVVPTVLLPLVAGAVVDRLPRRLVLLGADAVSPVRPPAPGRGDARLRGRPSPI